MSYKSAILGCGPRSIHHIRAYDGLKEIELKAVCDRDKERLNACEKKSHITSLYKNLEEMLEKERPDILHIVTPPTIREEPMELAGHFGVKGIIVEKPIALNISQAQRIKAIAEKYQLKVAVNTQRTYFQTCQKLKKALDAGTIGDVYFIRCVTRGNILSMGPHMMDLLLFYLNYASPRRVWAMASGMNGYDYNHPAPANMLIQYIFPGQVTVYFEDAENTIGSIGEKEFWQTLELNFWGTKGRAWWTQNRDWGYQAADKTAAFVEKSRWDEDEPPGQREFTRAMARWLADDRQIHFNCLANALKAFEAIMAAFYAAYVGKPVELPTTIPDDIAGKLEARLK